MVISQKQRTEAEISDHTEHTRGSYRATTEKISVTINIGGTEKSRGTDTAEAVLKGADTALHKAKKSGRNRKISDLQERSFSHSQPSARLALTIASGSIGHFPCYLLISR